MKLHRLYAVHLGAAVLDEGPMVVLAVEGSDGAVIYKHLTAWEASDLAGSLAGAADEALAAADDGHPSAGPAGPEDAVFLLRLSAEDRRSGVRT